MKLKLLAVAAFSLLAANAHANIEAILLLVMNESGRDATIYYGNSQTDDNIAYTIKDKGKVFRGDGRFTSVFDAIYTIRDGKVFKGRGTASWDTIYTIKDDRIYEKDGKFTSVFDALYTLKGEKIFRGNSTSHRDIVYTRTEGVLHRGNSVNNLTDILFTIKFH